MVPDLRDAGPLRMFLCCFTTVSLLLPYCSRIVSLLPPYCFFIGLHAHGYTLRVIFSFRTNSWWSTPFASDWRMLVGGRARLTVGDLYLTEAPLDARCARTRCRHAICYRTQFAIRPKCVVFVLHMLAHASGVLQPNVFLSAAAR